MDSISKKKIKPSIIDRLIDHEPENRHEVTSQHAFILNNLKNSVRRDLESLFNTRFRIAEFPEEYRELEQSLVNYGLPDLATINIIDIDKRIAFCQKVENIIRYYEPRFKSVRVKYLNNTDEKDRTLRFRIEAVLYAEPNPEVIIFDSILEPITRNVSIEEAL